MAAVLGNGFSVLIKVDNVFKTLPCLVSVCLAASPPSLPKAKCAPMLVGEWVKTRAVLLS